MDANEIRRANRESSLTMLMEVMITELRLTQVFDILARQIREQARVSIARHDSTTAAHYHLVADHVERGMSYTEGL